MKEKIKKNITEQINKINVFSIQSIYPFIKDKKYYEVFKTLKQRNILLTSKQKLLLLDNSLEKNDFVLIKLFLTGEIQLDDKTLVIKNYHDENFISQAKMKIADVAIENKNFKLLRYVISGQYTMTIKNEVKELKDSKILDLDFDYQSLNQPLLNKKQDISNERIYDIEKIMKKLLVQYPYDEMHLSFYKDCFNYILNNTFYENGKEKKDVIIKPDMYRELKVNSQGLNMNKVLYFLGFYNLNKDDSKVLLNDSICQFIVEQVKKDGQQEKMMKQVENYYVSPHMNDLIKIKPLMLQELTQKFMNKTKKNKTI